MIALPEIIAVRGVIGKMQLAKLTSSQRNDIRFVVAELEAKIKEIGALEQTIINDFGLTVSNDNRIDTSKLSEEQQSKFTSEMTDLHNRPISLDNHLSNEVCDLLIASTPDATCNDMMLLDKLRTAEVLPINEQ